MEEKKVFNAGPLGLMSFGLTTILLNLHNAGITEMSVVIVGMGIFLGGLAQIVAVLLSFRNNNTFLGTAFTGFGFFWLSLVYIWNNGGADLKSMGFYLLLWGIFTTFMAIGTRHHTLVSKLVFSSLALLFYLLAIGDFTGVTLITRIGGVVGIISGLLALYDSVAQIVNSELEKEVLPLG